MLARHPANLALRFTLEIVALVALLMWGWQQPPPARYWFGLALPLLLMAAWAVFRAPGDLLNDAKHRTIPIPGWLRLALELVVFALGALALVRIGKPVLAGVFFGALLLHHFWSVERVVALLRPPARPKPRGTAAKATKASHAAPRSPAARAFHRHPGLPRSGGHPLWQAANRPRLDRRADLRG